MRTLGLLLAILTLAASARAQPVDLLRAVRTDLAVSSAYRDRITQAAALVDGDLETAWNSRTGDLAGAWIEVRVPASAQVTSIVLTAGFTKRSGQSDLFTGNHRVTSVRVSRDGQAAGVFPVDPESRELQSLPVTGPGGTYRIEIAAVRPGTRASWREVCISELRVMGTMQGARAGQRYPRLAMRALPAPRPEPGTGDRAALDRRTRDLTLRLAREWGALNREEGLRRRACMLDEEDQRAAVELRARRHRFLIELAELVEQVDEARGDGLRAAAFARAEQSSWDAEFLDRGDHELVASGFRAVADWLASDETRCRWVSADALVRLGRAADDVRALNHRCEHLDMDYPDGAPREVERECRVTERLVTRLEELESGAGRSLRTAAPRIRALQLPQLSTARAGEEWAGLLAALELARTSCAWGD